MRCTEVSRELKTTADRVNLTVVVITTVILFVIVRSMTAVIAAIKTENDQQQHRNTATADDLSLI